MKKEIKLKLLYLMCFLALVLIILIQVLRFWTFLVRKESIKEGSVSSTSSASPMPGIKIKPKTDINKVSVAEITDVFDNIYLTINKRQEKVYKGKKLYDGDIVDTKEGTILIIDSKGSSIFAEKYTIIVVTRSGLILRKGNVEVRGKISVDTGRVKVNGQGRVKIKILENEKTQIALYEGNGKVIEKNSSEQIEMKGGEGLIVEKNGNFSSPFKLPSPPEEIKVRVY